LINLLGWRQTSLLLGLAPCLTVLPLLALFLYSSPRSRGLEAFGDDATPSRDVARTYSSVVPEKAVWRTQDFWFLLLPFFICGMTTTGLMDTHLIPYAHDHGFSPATTGLAVSVLAAFNIFGTLVSGVLANRWDNARMLGFLYLGRAASLIVLVFVGDPIMLIVFAALFGLVDFATLAPTQLLATRLFRGGIGTVFGYLFMSHQIGSAVGSFVPGLVYDLTGGYVASLSGATTLLLVASVLSFAIGTSEARASHTNHVGRRHG
jgi:predicted MFS family arabinose efflux permease